MRVLRLGNSDDLSPGVADEKRAWYIAAAMLAEEVGEQVETIVKPIWPTPDLPERLARCIDEYQPDIVFMKINRYWYAYESVPLRIRRIFGPAGKPVASAGLRAAKNQRLARNRLFKLGRRMAHRLIGGDTPFHTRDIVELMSVCIREMVARESVALVVKGTAAARQNEEALAGYYHRFLGRADEVEGALKRLCEELHVPWNAPAPRSTKQDGLKGGDGVHQNAIGQQRMGRQEGQAMIDGWRVLHGREALGDAAAAT